MSRKIMNNHPANKEGKQIQLSVSALAMAGAALVVSLVLIYGISHPKSTEVEKETLVPATVATHPASSNQVENGVDVDSGFIAEGDYQLVKVVCTACHSAKLVTQNRATREGWEQMIRWMQETQKLWDLGASEDKILDYLATHYAPENKGRRAQLQVKEWYEIK